MISNDNELRVTKKIIEEFTQAIDYLEGDTDDFAVIERNALRAVRADLIVEVEEYEQISQGEESPETQA
jgi:hypothetical protein